MSSFSRTAASRSTGSARNNGRATSSRLRETTRAESSSPSESNADPQDTITGGEILRGKRQRNVKKSYVVESESDDEDEEDEPDGDDADQDEEDEDMEDIGDEEDAEGEDDDADADGDIDMDGPPPAPTIKISDSTSGKLAIAAKSSGKMTKRKEANASDEELSDLDSDDVDNVDEEDANQTGGDEDAEGEDDEDIDVTLGQIDDDAGLDSDADIPSRASTPDLSKMTKRQRARLDESADSFLMKLPDEPQIKKHLTAEEHAMRRAEMARRRKNLSEKRNEEEKMETINKLLKKQPSKGNGRRGKDPNGNSVTPAAGESPTGDAEPEKPNPTFVRWVSNKDGCRLGVPQEWLDGPAGLVLQNSESKSVGGLVGEVS